MRNRLYTIINHKKKPEAKSCMLVRRRCGHRNWSRPSHVILCDAKALHGIPLKLRLNANIEVTRKPGDVDHPYLNSNTMFSGPYCYYWDFSGCCVLVTHPSKWPFNTEMFCYPFLLFTFFLLLHVLHYFLVWHNNQHI